MTALRNGCIARLPSRKVSTSFSAVMRNEKLIHIGITKIITTTAFARKWLVARMYASGYASSTQTMVVTAAIARL